MLLAVWLFPMNTIERRPSNKDSSTQHSSLSDPWVVLETLLAKLGETQSTNHAVAMAVEAARTSANADLAFWYSKSNNKVSAMSGKRTFPADQATRIAKLLLSRLPQGGEVLRWVNPEGRQNDELPEAAMIVGDNRTQGCIVVLSFDGERRFNDGDVKATRMAIKMLLAQRAQAQHGTKALLNSFLQCLTTIIDAKDPYTAGHSERVARIGVLLVKEMGLPESNVGDIYLAGLLHDVGKIGLRDELLQRPTKLTAEEMEEVRRHPVIGEKIVASIQPFDRLRPAVRHHHEFFNGRGYPDGLAGENIPLLARIIGVAEACDAMMSPRRYRAARSPYEIDAVFNAESGRQFDPQVIRAFMAIRHEIYPPIYQKGIGESAFHAIGGFVDNLTEGSMMSLPAVKDTK
jgi:HD-GYP domain-containing protein (c-di-GMP phosphodiesterase class II)